MDLYERALTRRELLRLGLAANVAALWTPRGLLWGWDQQALPATPSTILGPFYPLIKPPDRDSDLTRIAGRRVRAQGQVLHVAGRVLNVRGEPVADARVELWQANAMGRYNHPSDANPAPLDPGFEGYGVQITDREGRFRFTTIKPGPYPVDNVRVRSPHLHFEVTGRHDRRVTQLFFAGEPLNEQDFVLQAAFRNQDRLLAELLPPPSDADPRSRSIRWDIVVPTG
jgi:protocatechuate 3,4-dioxygenase, beta subunit